MSARERLISLGLGALALCCLLVAVGLLTAVLVEGAPALAGAVFGAEPASGGAAGLRAALLGTVLVSLFASAIALPLGFGAGVYFAEYAPEGAPLSAARVTVRALSGLPPLLYGVAVALLLIERAGVAPSAVTAGVALGLMSLPWTITATDDALSAVPLDARRAAYALGASRWQALTGCVLPAARPALVAGLTLSVTRAAGETAPLLFTGVVYGAADSGGGLLDPFAALPYHLYVLGTQHPDVASARPDAFAAALALVALTGGLGAVAVALRERRAWPHTGRPS